MNLLASLGRRLTGRQPGPQARQWLLRLLLVNLFAATIVNGTRPMVSYRALTLGGGPFELGLITSAFSLFSMILALPIGRWVDRWGEVPFLALGSIFLCAGSALAAVSDSLLMLGVSQAVTGCGWILNLVACQALIANEGPRERREDRYGWYSTVSSLGQLVGPLLAAAIVGSAATNASGSAASLTVGSLQVVFALAAVSAVAGGLVGLGLLNSARSDRAAALATAPGGMLRAGARVLRRPGMLQAMFVSMAVISCVDVVAAYLPLYGDARGLSVGLVGTLLAIRAGASLVSRVFMNRLIATLGRSALLVGSMLLAGLGLGLVPFTAQPVLLTALMIVSGLGLGLGQPMTIAWVANRSLRWERATALGVRLAGQRGALFAVPTIMGAVAGAAGVAAIFWVLAGLLGSGAWVAAASRFDAEAEPTAGLA